MSKELVAVLVALFLGLGFALGEASEGQGDPLVPPTVEVGVGIEPGG